MTGYRASLIGTDLVIQTPDGRRHDLGRVVGRDARQPTTNELIAAAREVIASNIETLRGDPGQTPTDEQLRAVCSSLGITPTYEQMQQMQAVLADQVPSPQSVADLLAPHVASTLADVARKAAKAIIIDEIAPAARVNAIEALPGIIGPLLPDVCERLIDSVLKPSATDAARVAALAWIRDHRADLVGAVPDHEWKGTRLRFRKPDGSWGEWRELEGRKGAGGGAFGAGRNNSPGVASIAVNPDNTITITQTDGTTLTTTEAITVPFDDYSDVEYLADQTSTGAVLDFNFLEGPVQKIWVLLIASSQDDTSTARCRVDGVDPTATVGTLLNAGQVQPISSPPTTNLKVLAPAGKTISVYAYRR